MKYTKNNKFHEMNIVKIFKKKYQEIKCYLSSAQWGFLISSVLLAVSIGFFVQYDRYQEQINLKRQTANLIKLSEKNALIKAQQRNDPFGISTVQLSASISAGDAFVIIDVREPEELEKGLLPNTMNIRYADINNQLSDSADAPRSHSNFLSSNFLSSSFLSSNKDKHVILVDFTGVKSRMLVHQLYDVDLAISFLVGGIEKWLSEARPLLLRNNDMVDVRAIESFVNSKKLLDTVTVEALVAEKNTHFIDVRSESEFLNNAIPGAKNIPFIDLESSTLAQVMAELPKDAYFITPCYDQSSCFYAKLFGLKLVRNGLNFLGRYTTPDEYVATSIATVNHLEKNNSDIENNIFNKKNVFDSWENFDEDTWLEKLAKPFELALVNWQGPFLNLGMVIILLTLLLEIGIIPLVFKSEWDRLKAIDRSVKEGQLKNKIKHDQYRLDQALKYVAKIDNKTTVFNLLGKIIHLLLFVALFTAVDHVSEIAYTDTFFNLLIAEQDPTFILPIFIAMATYFMMKSLGWEDSQWYRPVRIAATILMLVLAALLPLGLNLLLLTTVCVSIAFKRGVQWLYHQYGEHSDLKKDIFTDLRLFSGKSLAVLPIQKVRPGFGGGMKAERLADLMRAGFPVLPGFSISSKVLAEEDIASDHQRAIENAWVDLNIEKAMVQSSVVDSDRRSEFVEQSVIDSDQIMDVSFKGLFKAIAAIQADGPKKQTELGEKATVRSAIIVQNIANCEYSGTLYREDGLTSGSCVVELLARAPKTAPDSATQQELLAGGSVEVYRFGRYTHQTLTDQKSPIDLMPLLELGKNVEKYVGGYPQDIEFTFCEGQFYLLAVRTSAVALNRQPIDRGFLERERRRVCELFQNEAPGDEVLEKNTSCHLPDQPSRFTMSLLNALWAEGGPVNRARAQFGLPSLNADDEQDHFVSVFGSLYVSRVNRVSGTEISEISENPITLLRMARSARELESQYRQVFLPEHLYQLKIRRSIQLNQLSLNDLVLLGKTWLDDFIHVTFHQVSILEVVTNHYIHQALKQLESRGFDARSVLNNQLETSETYSKKLLLMIKKGDLTEQSFLEYAGHRSDFDFELASPSYCEDLDSVLNRMDYLGQQELGQQELGQQVNAQNVSSATPAEDYILEPALKATVERARQFMVLLADARHYAFISLRQLRPVFKQLAVHLGLPEDGLFHLTMPEIYRLTESSFVGEVKRLVSRRSDEIVQFSSLETPRQFTLKTLETFAVDQALFAEGVGYHPLAPDPDCQTDEPDSAVKGGHQLLPGIAAFLNAEVAGRARVISRPEQMELFQPGEILVTASTNSDWMPIFCLASGVVTQYDGPNDHAAMTARASKIPALVSVHGATQIIQTGDFVRLMEDGHVDIERPTRRSSERFPLYRPVSLQSRDEWVKATMINVSITGALVTMTTQDRALLSFSSTGSLPLLNGQSSIDYTLEPRGDSGAVLHFVRPLSDTELGYLCRRQDERFLVNRSVDIVIDAEYHTLSLINISRGGGLLRLDHSQVEWAESHNHQFKGQLLLEGFRNPIEFISGRRVENHYAIFFEKRLSLLQLQSVLEDGSERVMGVGANAS